MKKYLLFCLFVLINLSVSAQDVIASFLDKHGKDDNLEVVSIGKKMMEAIIELTSDNPGLTEAIKGVETIRIVSSKEGDLNKEYYNSAQQLLSESKKLKEFFSISENDRKLTVMTRESRGNIKELLLLSEQADGFNFISIRGTIHLDDLLNYSESLNIKELKKLHSVKRNQ